MTKLQMASGNERPEMAFGNGIWKWYLEMTKPEMADKK